MNNASVIMFLVDSLRWDVLYRMYKKNMLHYGYKFMIENGFVCTDVYATSCPTQFSLPSLFTSTYPMDYGGYDRGILNRPKSFVELLNENEYQCNGIATCPWDSSLFGYNRGFNSYYDGFDLDIISSHLINELYLNFYIDLVFYKKITIQQAEQLRKSFLSFSIPFLKKMVTDRLDSSVNNEIFEWNYTTKDLKNYLIEIENFEHKIFNSDLFNLKESCIPVLNSEKSIYQYHYKKIPLPELIGKYLLKNIFQFLNIKYNKKKFSGRLQSLELLELYKKLYPISDKGKTFQYIHILDVHDFIFSRQRSKYQFSPLLIRPIYPDIRNAFYEASILWTDKTIGSYIKHINQSCKKPVLFALIGDHGNKYGFPSKGENRPLSEEIYHDTLNTTMIFAHKDLNHKFMDNSISLIDFAPTLLDLLQIKIDKSFKGVSVISNNIDNNRNIISENCGKGPGLFKYKPINISIKKKDYKLIYKENELLNGLSNPTLELYSKSDFYERKNLIDDIEFSDTILELKSIAVNRINEIRSLY